MDVPRVRHRLTAPLPVPPARGDRRPRGRRCRAPRGSEGLVRAKLGPHGPYVVEVDVEDLAAIGGGADAANPEMRLFFFGLDELTWLHDDPPV